MKDNVCVLGTERQLKRFVPSLQDSIQSIDEGGFILEVHRDNISYYI
jgi:hypothetical protein